MKTWIIIAFVIALSFLTSVSMFLLYEPSGEAVSRSKQKQIFVTHSEFDSVRKELTAVRTLLHGLQSRAMQLEVSADPELNQRLFKLFARVDRLEELQSSSQGATVLEFGDGVRSQVSSDQVEGSVKGIEQTIEERSAAEALRSQIMVANLEDHLHSESLDEVWTSYLQDSLATMLENDTGVTNQLVSAQCQTRLCRLEVNQLDGDASDEFISAITQLEAFQESEGYHQTIYQADGTETTVLYITRQGYRLPKIDYGDS